MRIQNLSGLFSGAGFETKRGRFIQFEDAGYIKGPVDIRIDNVSGKILAIEKTGTTQDPIDEVKDGTGLVATAGFIDSHTHAIFAGERSNEYFLRWSGASYAEISASGAGIHNTNRATSKASDDVLLDLLVERLRKMRSTGTTCVEIKSGYGPDPQSDLRLLKVLKKLRERKLTNLPDFHVTFLGLHALPKGMSEKSYVDGMIGLLAEIKKEGFAEFIDAFPEKGFFSLEESLRYIQAGQAMGLKAKVHADEITDMNAAATFSKAGALSVDHLQKISETGISALAESETIATLLPATSFYSDLPYADARKLLDSGVAVALATDFNPGTAPESSLMLTLLLAASRYRMSAAEILCAVTRNAAQALGRADLGSLRVGQKADVLLWQETAASPEAQLQALLLGAAELVGVENSIVARS